MQKRNLILEKKVTQSINILFNKQAKAKTTKKRKQTKTKPRTKHLISESIRHKK